MIEKSALIFLEEETNRALRRKGEENGKVDY